MNKKKSIWISDNLAQLLKRVLETHSEFHFRMVPLLQRLQYTWNRQLFTDSIGPSKIRTFFCNSVSWFLVDKGRIPRNILLAGNKFRLQHFYIKELSSLHEEQLKWTIKKWSQSDLTSLNIKIWMELNFVLMVFTRKCTSILLEQAHLYTRINNILKDSRCLWKIKTPPHKVGIVWRFEIIPTPAEKYLHINHRCIFGGIRPL